MKDSIVQQCLEILKRDDIKNEIKLLCKPFIDFILYEINPYIYLTVSLIFMIFIMNLATLILFIIFLRNKSILNKMF
jgi:hypothetical protein